MDVDTISKLGEYGGGAIFVVSLLYLVLQAKQSSQQQSCWDDHSFHCFRIVFVGSAFFHPAFIKVFGDVSLVSHCARGNSWDYLSTNKFNLIIR